MCKWAKVTRQVSNENGFSGKFVDHVRIFLIVEMHYVSAALRYVVCPFTGKDVGRTGILQVIARDKVFSMPGCSRLR